MRKNTNLIIVLLMVFTLVGCSGKENKSTIEESMRPNFEVLKECNVNGNNKVYFPEAIVGDIGTREKNNENSNIIFIWDKVDNNKYGYYISITNYDIEKCIDKDGSEISKGSSINIEKGQFTNTLYENYPLILVDRSDIEIIK